MSDPQTDAQAFWNAAAPATFTTYTPGVGEDPGTPMSRNMSDWTKLETSVNSLVQGVQDLYGPTAQVTPVTARRLNPKLCQVTINCKAPAS